MVTVFVSSEGLWFPEGVVVSYVSGSEHGRGVVVVAPALDGEYVLHQLFKVFAVAGQVQVLGVDNQQRRRIVIMKKLRISLMQRLQIIQADALFGGNSSLANAFSQNRGGSLQVNDQVGFRCINGEFIVHLLVNEIGRAHV